MKNLLSILALTLWLSTHAQFAKVPIPNAQDSLINKYTPSGQKTGLWVKYYYDNGGNRRIINTGNYSNGKKIGVWKYYQNEGCYACLDTSICPPVTEVYETDGSVTIIGLGILHINADSTVLNYEEKNRWKESCQKNAKGGYDCIRVYDVTNRENIIKKTFDSFDYYYYYLGSKW